MRFVVASRSLVGNTEYGIAMNPDYQKRKMQSIRFWSLVGGNMTMNDENDTVSSIILKD
jgi:hypothetical protein